MQRGYIKVWRKIEDSGLMDNAEVCRLFLHLLLKASAKRRKWLAGASSVELLPGQLITGRKKLAADLRSTERKVRTCLAALENMGIIDQQTTSKFTVISFVNWHRYQAGQPDGGQRSGREAAEARPVGVPLPPTKQEEKKKEEDHVSPDRAAFLPGDPEDTPLPAANAGRGASGVSPDAFSLSSPGPEFAALRARYDKLARPEAPLAGFAEYRQCRAAGLWPGERIVYAAIDDLAQNDAGWLRGFAPGLARFLREQQWRKKPAAPRTPPASNGPARTAGGLDPILAHNMEAAARVLARRE